MAPVQPAWEDYRNPSAEVPNPMSYIPAEYSNQAYTSQGESPESMADLANGLMMTGESGMDEQWISFMRQTGLLSSINPGTEHAESLLN
jgi:hypothetical protein